MRLDLTRDEVLAETPVPRPISHPYPDALPGLDLPGGGVLGYTIAELFAEAAGTGRTVPSADGWVRQQRC